MYSNQRVARIVGALFIVGTVAGILGAGFAGSILNAPDYLIQISANRNQVTLGALCVLIMGFALAMVPVMMFPILKQQNEALALGYVVFRGGLETVMYIATVICWLVLITLSQHFVDSGSPAASYFRSLGVLLQEGSHWIAHSLEIVFSLGALIFYSLLYQSRLVPRWLSVWGLIAAVLYLTAGVLGMFAIIRLFSTIQLVMNLPLAIQEMVMAIWLIARGFNASAIGFESAKTK